MNILFFLKPKAELDLVYEDDTVEMAMERIEDHQFSSIPMINEKATFSAHCEKGMSPLPES